MEAGRDPKLGTDVGTDVGLNVGNKLVAPLGRADQPARIK